MRSHSGSVLCSTGDEKRGGCWTHAKVYRRRRASLACVRGKDGCGVRLIEIPEVLRERLPALPRPQSRGTSSSWPRSRWISLMPSGEPTHRWPQEPEQRLSLSPTRLGTHGLMSRIATTPRRQRCRSPTPEQLSRYSLEASNESTTRVTAQSKIPRLASPGILWTH